MSQGDPVKLFKIIYLRSLNSRYLLDDFLKDSGLDPPQLKKLMDEGYLEAEGNFIRLTERGRRRIRVVFTGGVFDIIHPGHVHTLKEARSLGDVLLVSIARKSNIRKFKGVEPLHDDTLRQELVQSIRYVDLALLGDEHDIMKTVELVRPDIIVLGYDQVHQEKDLIEAGRKRGLSFEVKRLGSPYPGIKTRKIKELKDDIHAF